MGRSLSTTFCILNEVTHDDFGFDKNIKLLRIGRIDKPSVSPKRNGPVKQSFFYIYTEMDPVIKSRFGATWRVGLALVTSGCDLWNFLCIVRPAPTVSTTVFHVMYRLGKIMYPKLLLKFKNYTTWHAGKIRVDFW